MTPLRRGFYAYVVVPLGLALVKLFWRSCRVVAVTGAEHLDAALARAPSLIPCYWHQHQLFCAKWLLEQRARGLHTGFLISPSVDGEIGAMMVARANGFVIRGSSTSTGARALRDFYEALVKLGISPIITPDGPRGPRFVCKPGAVLLAQMSGRPILPMSYCASRAMLIKWDKFVIPWPFSRIVIAIGEPRYLPRTLTAARMHDELAALGVALHSLYRHSRATLQAF
jgi:lysophospholipid acyltransferase (LPLAT)-like uncharacterized protein